MKYIPLEWKPIVIEGQERSGITGGDSSGIRPIDGDVSLEERGI